jgi:uncharacterized protein (DUF433 family)
MISAEVIKGVKELLEERGVVQKPDERFGDFVARGLGISARQTEILLESLHDGHTVEDAIRAADISATDVSEDLLIQVARAIGVALARLTPKK